MKKTISLLAIGAITAFFAVNAQDSQQTESTTTEHAEKKHQQQSQNVQDQNKKKIDESELPDQVKQSLSKGEYADMDVVVAYEVEGSDNVSQNKGETMRWNEAQSQTSDTILNNANKQQVITDQQDARSRGSVTSEQDTILTDVQQNAVTEEENQSADRLNEGDEQRLNDQLEEDPNTDSEIVSSENMSDSAKMYEIQLESEDKVMILVFTEEGELRQATEGDDGM